MGLEITRKKDGTLRSKYWYGRVEINGQTKSVSLNVKIKGRAPDTHAKGPTESNRAFPTLIPMICSLLCRFFIPEFSIYGFTMKKSHSKQSSPMGSGHAAG
ncbi:MAG: hypothetical protein OEL75_03695 [Kiritimatiellaceae bacterium]|nr:hypothetical protein [Kiritimatiellaceae bacterium]